MAEREARQRQYDYRAVSYAATLLMFQHRTDLLFETRLAVPSVRCSRATSHPYLLPAELQLGTDC